MAALAHTAHKFGRLPSELIGIGSPVVALDFNIACATLLYQLEKEAYENARGDNGEPYERTPDGGGGAKRQKVSFGLNELVARYDAAQARGVQVVEM